MLMKNLLKSNALLAQESCLNMQAMRFVVSEESVCSICGKRLGSSVIAAEAAGGDVMHFVCYKKLSK